MAGNMEDRPARDVTPITARLDPQYLNGDKVKELEHRIDRAAAVLNDPAYSKEFKVHVAYWILKGEPDSE